MNNLYFIESDSFDLIDIKVNEILNKNNLTRDNLIIYDLEEINISDAIVDLDTYSLFSEKKVVLCLNSCFLTTTKCEIEHDISSLEKYLNNPNMDNILILSSSKVDGKKNIVKLVKEKCTIVDTNIDLVNFVKEKTVDYIMKDDVIRYFLVKVGEDLANIINELDKVLMYKSNNEEITKKDIDLIVIKKIDRNIYDLIDAIINKDKEKSLTIYQEMINYGEDVFKIFISLANQIRLIYQVKVLKDLPDNEIYEMLNLKNSKQVVALRYKIGKYNTSNLLDYLHKLSIMDEELKSGKSIDKIVFPIFIANL